MPFPVDNATLTAYAAEAENVSKSLGLPFRSVTWQGSAGNWQGAGVGSSVDFQDHRPYLAGDDPRYINWQAYARTNNYTLKLYREEVSPSMDIVFDMSESMAVDDAKARRSLETLFFCLSSGQQTMSSLRCYTVHGPLHRRLEPTAFKSSQWLSDRSNSTPDPRPAFSKIPFRARAMRIIITDLLYSGSPQDILPTPGGERAPGIVFVPYSVSESEPDWFGNTELIDCESKTARLKQFDNPAISDYKKAYREHFDMWSTYCRQKGYKLARIRSDNSLLEALSAQPLMEQAVELWA